MRNTNFLIRLDHWINFILLAFNVLLYSLSIINPTSFVAIVWFQMILGGYQFFISALFNLAFKQGSGVYIKRRLKHLGFSCLSLILLLLTPVADLIESELISRTFLIILFFIIPQCLAFYYGWINWKEYQVEALKPSLH